MTTGSRSMIRETSVMNNSFMLSHSHVSLGTTAMTSGTVVDNTSGSLVTVARMVNRAFHAHTVLDSFLVD